MYVYRPICTLNSKESVCVGQADEEEVLGLSEEEEDEDEEESEGEEEEEEEFKLPPALQRQFLASDDEDPSEKHQTGTTHFCTLLCSF